MQAWAACFGTGTTACGPLVLGDDQSGEQRGPDLKHNNNQQTNQPISQSINHSTSKPTNHPTTPYQTTTKHNQQPPTNYQPTDNSFVKFHRLAEREP